MNQGSKVNYAAIRKLRQQIKTLVAKMSELAGRELVPGTEITYYMRGYRQTGVIQKVFTFGDPRVRVKSDKSGKVYDIYLSDIKGIMTPDEARARAYHDQ